MGNVFFGLLHVNRHIFTRIYAVLTLWSVCSSRRRGAASLYVLILFRMFSCYFHIKVVQCNMEGLSLLHCLALGREYD